MMKPVLTGYIGLIIGAMLMACNEANHAVRFPPDTPFQTLSEYHLFSGKMSDLLPNDRVIPYDVNTPLFSDYASKARFIWVPAQQKVSWDTAQVLDLPMGSILVKNFFYPDKEDGKRMIETRLMLHQESGWNGYTYLWDENQKEATLSLTGAIVPVNYSTSEIDYAFNYLVPNKNQCKSCHSYDERMQPIGIKIANLNREFEYEEGAHNQLDHWIQLGILEAPQTYAIRPKMAVWNDEQTGTLHERAMAYLDVNCGHCHNPHGPGGTTGLNLVYHAAKDINLGIHKAVVAAGKGAGNSKYSIVPGHPELSVLPYRMQSTEIGVMMPEIGRTQIHEAGVELIKTWIQNMELELDKDREGRSIL